MTRWKDTCQLIDRSFEMDDEGVALEYVYKTEVYCNSYTLSTQAWATARLADYTADDEIQLRTEDYSGQSDVIWKGKAYTVEREMCQGDFTRLILKRKKSDVGDDDA